LSLKGIANLYEYCCDGHFYEWDFFENHAKTDPNIHEKFVCMAPVFYKDHEILTLKEDHYDPIIEEQSTWKIAKFIDGVKETRLPHRPYKYFQLESNDDLMLLKCKIRPVLLIKKIKCDWKKPDNYFFDTWLCLPIFSYKNRHSQRYVMSDQKLAIPNRFYFPPGIPGLEEEGCGLLNELQFIPENNLYPYKSFCDQREAHMDRPVMLSKKAFCAVIGHVSKLLPEISISGESKDWYDFFKDLVNEEVERKLRTH